jgi:hypothetical protein
LIVLLTQVLTQRLVLPSCLLDQIRRMSESRSRDKKVNGRLEIQMTIGAGTRQYAQRAAWLDADAPRYVAAGTLIDQQQ